jgi:hypothetical protein
VKKLNRLSNKVLLVFPYWGGDKQQMCQLVRLLADLEPEHSEVADVLFLPRFDSSFDDETIKYVSRKFNVHKYQSKRRERGWPGGCNGLWFSAVEWIGHKIEARQILNYRAVINIEADGAPLYRDWLERLIVSWDLANTEKRAYVGGALVNGGGRWHINGGCMFFSTDSKFLKWLVKSAASYNSPAGWDWILAKEFSEWGWADLAEIKSYWRRPAFEESEWEPELDKGTVWIHGVKDSSLLDLARKKLLHEP